MKRFFAVFVVFGLGVGVGKLFDDEAPVAEAGQEPGCAPLLVTGGGFVIQDMDGDGDFNPITEAVRLLSWAFLGGPAPVTPCAGGGPSRLPTTGQTACLGFDQEQETWVEVPCVEAACAGQDGAYATGCGSEGRFVDNEDGTVTDTCTGLMWQKDTADVNGDGQSTDQDFTNWCRALGYCENLSLAGHDDWRLPNVRELQSIVDYGRFSPSIDPVFGALSYFYWSSTSFAYDRGGLGRVYAWIVFFRYGLVQFDDLDGDKYVRAVRGGQ